METIIAQIEETEQATERQEFHITDEASANWLLRKLANLEAEKQRVKAQAVEILASLDADAARLRFLYESELEHFTRERLTEGGGRTKTLRLLQGTVAFRTVPASLRVVDTDAALPHAHALGCTRTEVDAGAYRQAAQKTLADSGELLPGVEIVPERESFSIRFGRDKGGQPE